MKINKQNSDDIILMAHGGGGVLTKKLIDELIVRELGNPILNQLDDGACLTMPESEIVMTTDSYVVDPVFFPGGDIGTLAVCGTVNDLAMQGAEPKYMSMSLIIEEGFFIRDLKRIILSISDTVKKVNVLIVTGDIKVVERSAKKGLFINTTGIGKRLPEVDVSVSNALPGDAVIITGTLGDHGIAIMNQREGLQLESGLLSDVAPLWSLIKPVLNDIPNIHCLRDPTRGGIASALCDIANASSCGIQIQETALPIKEEVTGACDILGLDPLNVANEGKAVIVCSNNDSAQVIKILKNNPLGKNASVIGKVVKEHSGIVSLETKAGGKRIVDMPTGESLPRIC